jgi:hypothetical protein
VTAAVTALAVATVVGRYYSPDAYYLNTHERIAGHYLGTRIAALAVLGVIAAATAPLRPRAGAALAAVDLALCAVVVSGEGYNN